MEDKSPGETPTEPAVNSSNIPPEDLNMYLPPSQRRKRKWPRVVGIIILILVILAIAYGIYWLLFGSAGETAPPPPAPKQSQTVKPKQISDTNNYESADFNLSFDYPKSWRVDNSKNDLLTVTSPSLELTGASGNQQQARIVMAIQPKGTVPQPLQKKGAVAVLASQKINYNKPSSVQLAQTYLSYLQYSATTTHGGLDAIYVTSNFGYKYGQYIPTVDIKKLDPLITVTFEQCSDAKCAKPTPVTLSSTSWQGSTQQKTVQAMLKSIRINS